MLLLFQSNYFNPKLSSPRNNKLSKAKTKNPKSSKRKEGRNLQRNPNHINGTFLNENFIDQERAEDIFKVMKEKLPTKNILLGKVILRK